MPESNKKPLGFNLSASTINAFHSCPWQWAQGKILKRTPPRDPSPYLVLGNSFHHIMEEFYKREFTYGAWNTKWIFNNWEKIFKIEAKKEGAEDLPQLKYIKATGFTMIKNWVVMAQDNGWLTDPLVIDNKPSIELKFAVPYENDRFEAKLTGGIDLVTCSEKKKTITIIDWKSGKHHDNYKIQGLIYSAALYKQYGITEDEVMFVHPAKSQNKIVSFQFKDTDYAEITQSVDPIFDAVEKNDFVKIKGDNCKYCPWTECENNVNEGLKKKEADRPVSKHELIS